MKFVLVNGRTPRTPDCCATCRAAIMQGYLRDLATARLYCDHRCYSRRRTFSVAIRQPAARAS